jgi:hypothetical protein
VAARSKTERNMRQRTMAGWRSVALGRDSGQRAGWWWARAWGEVLGSHDVVAESGHCSDGGGGGGSGGWLLVREVVWWCRSG